MFSKRVNTVIKTVNYCTLTFSQLSKLSLTCLNTQYFAIKTKTVKTTHTPLTLRYMYITMTRVKYPALQSARLKQRRSTCSVVLTRWSFIVHMNPAEFAMLTVKTVIKLRRLLGAYVIV